jgi:hypothetical protein
MTGCGVATGEEGHGSGEGEQVRDGQRAAACAHVREDRPPWVFEDILAGQLLNARPAPTPH